MLRKGVVTAGKDCSARIYLPIVLSPPSSNLYFQLQVHGSSHPTSFSPPGNWCVFLKGQRQLCLLPAFLPGWSLSLRWPQWACPVRGQGWSHWGASCCSRFCRPGWVRRAVGWGPAPSGYSSWSKTHFHNSLGQKMGRKNTSMSLQCRKAILKQEQRGFIRIRPKGALLERE